MVFLFVFFFWDSFFFFFFYFIFKLYITVLVFPNIKMNPMIWMLGHLILSWRFLWPPDAKSWLVGKDPDAGKDWRQDLIIRRHQVHKSWGNCYKITGLYSSNILQSTNLYSQKVHYLFCCLKLPNLDTVLTSFICKIERISLHIVRK